HLHRPPASLAPAPSLADLAPELGYAEWRDEVMSLSSITGASYHGSIDTAGGPTVVVLRGAVVSPLPPAGPAPEASFSWGDSGPGPHVLAGAVLVDQLGKAARCPDCPPGTGTCPLC